MSRGVPLVDRLRAAANPADPIQHALLMEAAAQLVRLRNELNEAYRDASREARDAYSQGQADHAAAERGEPPGTY